MPERDIESLGVMGWGVGWGWKILPPSPPSPLPPSKELCLWGTVSSRLGLRTEISARYYRQMTRMDVPHLFHFHWKCEQSVELSISIVNLISEKNLLLQENMREPKQQKNKNNSQPGNLAFG